VQKRHEILRKIHNNALKVSLPHQNNNLLFSKKTTAYVVTHLPHGVIEKTTVKV